MFDSEMHCLINVRLKFQLSCLLFVYISLPFASVFIFVFGVDMAVSSAGQYYIQNSKAHLCVCACLSVRVRMCVHLCHLFFIITSFLCDCFQVSWTRVMLDYEIHRLTNVHLNCQIPSLFTFVCLRFHFLPSVDIDISVSSAGQCYQLTARRFHLFVCTCTD